jgi:hypothetical protein
MFGYLPHLLKKINQLLYSCNKTITDFCYGLYKDLSIQEKLYLRGSWIDRSLY